MFIARGGFSASSRLSFAAIECCLDLDHAADADELAVIFSRFTRQFGLTSVAAVTLPRSGTDVTKSVLFNSRPSQWTEEYIGEALYAADPLIGAAAHATTPFAWSDVTTGRRLQPRERIVMSHAAGFGMRDGYVIPVFEAGGRTSILSLAGCKPDLSPVNRNALTLSAIYFHNRLCGFTRRRSGPDVHLTPREIEVLNWVAAGKSDWQIGQILQISAKTVNYHVENLKRKYGVASRTQAIVSALRDGKLAT